MPGTGGGADDTAAALLKTRSSSVIWVEFINTMTFLASYFCMLTAPTIEGTLSILAGSCPRVPNFGVILVPRQWTCETYHMNSRSGIIKIASVSLCSHLLLWTTTLFGLPVDPLPDFPSLPKVASIFPEKIIQSLRGHSVRHMSLFCDTQFLHAYLLLSTRHLQNHLQSPSI